MKILCSGKLTFSVVEILGGICFKILIVLSFNPYALNCCIFGCCIFGCAEGRALAGARALAIGRLTFVLFGAKNVTVVTAHMGSRIFTVERLNINIIYQAEVTTSTSRETYIGLCDTTFKLRYRNHVCSFRNE